ncbi:zinc-finger homeodomain protein 5-like [Gastrolobium bilobum]|uniref:zinc-finger homeodomain protein 5-like n=1 Tax=Gastrolobium bilobum TaxID=150636 RepID=UPI002AB30778|nr:zinc-finger homeodomain protein 5-like [Gastrolobium bilobum]
MSGINTNMPAATSFEKDVVFKACERNHTMSLGRVCYDGCQEFLGGGGKTKDAMLCAACDCHRSFHRKCIIYDPITQRQTENILNTNNSLAEVEMMSMLPKRRKRTVFTPEQKNQMMRFAENVGWTPKGANKDEIQRFCLEIGISRKTFLVWLSNNRHRAKQNNTK